MACANSTHNASQFTSLIGGPAVRTPRFNAFVALSRLQPPALTIPKSTASPHYDRWSNSHDALALNVGACRCLKGLVGDFAKKSSSVWSSSAVQFVLWFMEITPLRLLSAVAVQAAWEAAARRAPILARSDFGCW